MSAPSPFHPRLWLLESAERLLDLACVAPGAVVLDFAAGQTIAAARRVGARGRVLTADPSPARLEQTAARARAAGLTNVELRHMSADVLDLPGDLFDAVLADIGQLELHRLRELPRALAGMRRVLKLGGRLAVLGNDRALACVLADSGLRDVGAVVVTNHRDSVVAVGTK